jgi:hypothetical protein
VPSGQTWRAAGTLTFRRALSAIVAAAPDRCSVGGAIQLAALGTAEHKLIANKGKLDEMEPGEIPAGKRLDLWLMAAGLEANQGGARRCAEIRDTLSKRRSLWDPLY